MEVEAFLDRHQKKFGFELIAGKKGLKKRISSPIIEFPGLSLAGYLNRSNRNKILVFGKQEVSYLQDLLPALRLERLSALLNAKVPLIIFLHLIPFIEEVALLCEKWSIPLIRTRLKEADVKTYLSLDLEEQLAPHIYYHGSFVEVFNVGMLLEGDSSIGKSEAALGLIERGHCLISDDVVKVRRRGKNHLEGFSLPLSRHYMEVRGIGLIDIANLYGTISIREKKNIDVVVKLEVWNDDYFYDRSGLDEKTIRILGIEIPHHVLPVKPGRDIVLLLETIALNYQQKKLGCHSAKKLDRKLLATIEHKRKRRLWMKEI